MEHKFFVTCLIVKNNQILMLKKKKGRHIGAWLFPGGKIEAHEGPLDTVKREIQRDTGLNLLDVELRGIVNFMKQEFPEDPVLSRTDIYVFYSEHFEGELQPSNKGELEWINIADIWEREVGRNDKLFVPTMLENKKITFAKFYHNNQCQRVRYQID